MVIGSDTFIPGFEEQLLGVAAGERREVEATFPEAYATRKLAGQKANFDVTVKAVAAPEPLAIDDEFAKSLGVERLDELKETSRERIADEYARASREKVKRKLLDALAARYTFEVPEGLVEQEFASIWARSSASRRLPAAASPTKTPPRRRRAPNIAASPSGACASACCWPRSAPRPTFRSPTRK